MDAGAKAAWEAYQAWLQNEINTNPYIEQYPWSRVDYAQWWVYEGGQASFNNYKWN